MRTNVRQEVVLTLESLLAIAQSLPPIPRIIVGAPLTRGDSCYKTTCKLEAQTFGVIWMSNEARRNLLLAIGPAHVIHPYSLESFSGIPIEEWMSRKDHPALLSAILPNAVALSEPTS